MMKDFKYDVVQLINLIRERPCLWDKTLECYKDKIERKTAWEEIVASLDPNYGDMSLDDRRMTEPVTSHGKDTHFTTLEVSLPQTIQFKKAGQVRVGHGTVGDYIINKWTNIRDTFVRTLKTRLGKPKRKYILYEHLKFLTKVYQPEDPSVEVSIDNPDIQSESIDNTANDSFSYIKNQSISEVDTSYSHRKRKKIDKTEAIPKKSKKRNLRERLDSPEDTDEESGGENIDFVEVNEGHRLMNEDEAFFASLLPTVVKYTEDERLEFRIEVLAVMKKIKDGRNNFLLS